MIFLSFFAKRNRIEGRGTLKKKYDKILNKKYIFISLQHDPLIIGSFYPNTKQKIVLSIINIHLIYYQNQRINIHNQTNEQKETI